MAKRKRLDLSPFPAIEGAQLPELSPESAATSGLRSGLAAPIARIAGEAAQSAAFEEVSEELRRARAEGRLIQRLALDRIETEHLVRDRVGLDEAELAPLLDSLRARGQQTPIEVVELPGGRYGLVSGWRRVQALRRLAQEGGAEATVLALLRRPRDASEAYVAMVEENEIRLGLSHYERARIVARAVEAGVFPDAREALNRLFASGSRARRSKIGSFLAVVEALDGALVFPTAIGERLGLELAQGLERDPGLGARLRAALLAAPAREAAGELALLQRLVRAPADADGAARPREPQAGAAPQAGLALESPAWQQIAPGLRLGQEAGRLVLEGAALTPELAARVSAQLSAWLRGQDQG